MLVVRYNLYTSLVRDPSTPEGSLELISDAARRKYALAQRLKKVPYREISEELGVSVPTISQWVKEETAIFLPQPEADELRAQELANIDRDERRAEDVISLLKEQGRRWTEERKDVTAIIQEIRLWQDLIRKLRIDRANLLSLHAPLHVKHTHTVRTEFDQEIEALVAEMSVVDGYAGGAVLSKPEDVLLDDN